MNAPVEAPDREETATGDEPLNGQPDPQPDPEPQGDFEGEGPGEDAPTQQSLEIEGSRKQLTLKIGGLVPEQSQVKLRAGSISVPRGEYEKGETIDFSVTVRCTEVHMVDKMDNATGEVVDTIRRHIFKVSKITKV